MCIVGETGIGKSSLIKYLTTSNCCLSRDQKALITQWDHIITGKDCQQRFLGTERKEYVNLISFYLQYVKIQ